MVVVEDGLAARREYRRFKIRTVGQNDDFAAMEEVLTRRGELGIQVSGGTLAFEPALLKAQEFTGYQATFAYFYVAGEARELNLKAGCLAFTLCQVPVVYRLSDTGGKATVTLEDGTAVHLTGARLDPVLSRDVLSRSGRVQLIQVDIPDDALI